MQIYPDYNLLAIERAIEVSKSHQEVALILQATALHNWPLNEPFRLANRYKVCYRKISSQDEIKPAIDEASREGKIQILWIISHGNERQIIFSEKEGSFDSYKAFCNHDYRDMFSHLANHASIVLETCCAGGKTALEKRIEKVANQLLNKRKKITFKLPNGLFVSRESDCSNKNQFWDGDNENKISPYSYFIENSDKRIKTPYLNVAAAIAFLAEGRRVFYAKNKISADTCFAIDSLKPFRLKMSHNDSFLIMFKDSFSSLEVGNASISFEITMNGLPKQSPFYEDYVYLTREEYREMLASFTNSTAALIRAHPTTQFIII